MDRWRSEGRYRQIHRQIGPELDTDRHIQTPRPREGER